MKSEKQISIFYSWQSDLPKQTNLNAIRQSIRSSANNVESLIDNVIINLDEATRDVPGSPSIPQTIFQKIENSDIFICDLTTINTDAINTKRKTPNPNVLIELGFAVSQLGWHRIIMLFNTKYSEFKDLPFDIDRHRASQYLIVDKNDKNGRNKLIDLLNVALKSIIDNNPTKPNDNKELTNSERIRKRDIFNIRLIFSSFHTKTFDRFFLEMPSIIIHEIFYYKDLFDEIYCSSEFHIYDEKLKSILDNILKYWGKSLSFYKHYDLEHHGDNYKFYTPSDEFENKEAQNDYDTILENVKLLRNEFDSFLRHIRKEFIEIEIKKESDLAFEKFNIYWKKRLKL